MARVFTFNGSAWHPADDSGDIPISTGGGDDFTVGTTRPLWYGTEDARNNVGVLPGVARTTVSASSLNFSTPNQIFQNLNISDAHLVVSGSGHKFINCRFTYSFDGDYGGGMVDTKGSSCSNLYFEHCEWEPTTPGDRWNGVYGHDFEMYRCVITHTVDGIGGYNPYAQPLNVTVRGSWIGQLAWFNDDRPEVGDGHSDGTHNDGMQQGSGSVVLMEGNFYQGAKYNVLNPQNVTIDTNGMDFSVQNGNGVTPLDGSANNRHPQQGQLHLSKADVNYAVDQVTFKNNWCWNIDHGFKFQIGNAQGSTVAHVTVTGNRFGGTPRDYGGTFHYYPIRYASACVINGVQHSAGTYDDDGGNVWVEDANVVAQYGTSEPVAGHPVKQRVDA